MMALPKTIEKFWGSPGDKILEPLKMCKKFKIELKIALTCVLFFTCYKAAKHFLDCLQINHTTLEHQQNISDFRFLHWVVYIFHVVHLVIGVKSLFQSNVHNCFVVEISLKCYITIIYGVLQMFHISKCDLPQFVHFGDGYRIYILHIEIC